MAKIIVFILAFVSSISMMAQYPRNFVVIEEGTGTW